MCVGGGGCWREKIHNLGKGRGDSNGNIEFLGGYLELGVMIEGC